MSSDALRRTEEGRSLIGHPQPVPTSWGYRLGWGAVSIITIGLGAFGGFVISRYPSDQMEVVAVESGFVGLAALTCLYSLKKNIWPDATTTVSVISALNDVGARDETTVAQIDHQLGEILRGLHQTAPEGVMEKLALTQRLLAQNNSSEVRVEHRSVVQDDGAQRLLERIDQVITPLLKKHAADVNVGPMQITEKVELLGRVLTTAGELNRTQKDLLGGNTRIVLELRSTLSLIDQQLVEILTGLQQTAPENTLEKLMLVKRLLAEAKNGSSSQVRLAEQAIVKDDSVQILLEKIDQALSPLLKKYTTGVDVDRKTVLEKAELLGRLLETSVEDRDANREIADSLSSTVEGLRTTIAEMKANRVFSPTASAPASVPTSPGVAAPSSIPSSPAQDPFAALEKVLAGAPQRSAPPSAQSSPFRLVAVSPARGTSSPLPSNGAGKIVPRNINKDIAGEH